MVSTDEACPDYGDILRNFELAHDFVKTEFNVKPKIGMQLDPFGHSNAVAHLFAEMGLEAMVFARINPADFEARKLERDLQFIWQPSFANDNDKESDKKEIFAHKLFDHYGPPNFISRDLLWYGKWHKKPLHNSKGDLVEFQVPETALKWYAHF